MKLTIISPEQSLYNGEAEMVTLPGLQGSFTILENHAPIMSGLQKGTLMYRKGSQDISLPVEGGFIEASNNKVTVCVE